MANPFVMLRNKLVTDMEDIFQCPVCYEVLSKTIPLCIQGHHVCLKCQEKMKNCPFCKGDFVGTRNYLAESFWPKYEEIKLSLINPKKTENSIKMVCQQTQTDFDDELTNGTPLINTDFNQNVKKNSLNSLNSKATPAAGKGKFPCTFKNCSVELPHCRMLPHIRSVHNSNLIEDKMACTGGYTLEWEHSNLESNYERFISISNMGLFYLHIIVNDAGDLVGNVQIIHNALTARQFKYSLILSNTKTSINYNDQVMSCRTTPEKIQTKSLFVNSRSILQLMGDKSTVSCTLSLQRVVGDAVEQQKK